MNDDEFLATFEACTLSNQEFHHADHVRLAFVYLRRFSAVEAMRRFSQGLRNFAAHHGKPERYHETITWAFLLLIHERLARAYITQGQYPAWEEFTLKNPDLLNWKNNILKKYYSEEILASDLARKTFVFPDLILAR
jgi:hypothetical protein